MHRFCIQDPRLGPSVGRLSGRNDAQQRDTTLTNDERCPLVSAALGAVIRRPAWSPRRSCQSMWTLPSPGRQVSEMSSHEYCAARPGWAGCGIPSTSLRATTRHPGAEPDDARAGSVEGCPRAAVWSGCARSTRCHTAPTCKIIGDKARPLRSPVEKAPDRESGAWRADTQPGRACGSRSPCLHQLLHQRLRTTMNVLGPGPQDVARPWTTSTYWRGAACDYGSHG